MAHISLNIRSATSIVACGATKSEKEETPELPIDVQPKLPVDNDLPNPILPNWPINEGIRPELKSIDIEKASKLFIKYFTNLDFSQQELFLYNKQEI